MNAWRMAMLAATLALAGCAVAEPPPHLRIEGGDVRRGLALTQVLGCGSCHTIPRVRGARGIVGPPLDDFAQRTLLAGQLPNAPRTLARFLADPPALLPGTGMPSLGLGEGEARDIAAFLYTLGAEGAQIADFEPPLELLPSPSPPLALGVARP